MTHLQRFSLLEQLEKHITRAALQGNTKRVEKLRAEWERLVKEGDIVYKPK